MLRFDKYQGTGNDFIMVNALPDNLNVTPELIRNLCDRKFGIGADGFIHIRRHADYDFDMMYANSDGRESSMCGNGGRCAVAYANKMGYFNGNKTVFKAIDGIHHAQILPDNTVSLGMNDVLEVVRENGGLRLNTGSPHYVGFDHDQQGPITDFVEWARAIRASAPYRDAGINVNLVTPKGKDTLQMRTFERGVENETLSCGTGAVAAAIAWHQHAGLGNGTFSIGIHTPGGKLQVGFAHGGIYEKVVLQGPANHVFSGLIPIGT